MTLLAAAYIALWVVLGLLGALCLTSGAAERPARADDPPFPIVDQGATTPVGRNQSLNAPGEDRLAG